MKTAEDKSTRAERILTSYPELQSFFKGPEFDSMIEAMEQYASEQCQKRDELIKAQDELIICLEKEISITSFDDCDLEEHLKKNGFLVTKGHFGSAKDLKMYSPADKMQVIFRSYPKPEYLK